MDDGTNMVVDGCALPEYFHNEVERALAQLGVEVSEITEFYIVDLLSKFCKTESLFSAQGDTLTEEPLALILAKALNGDRASRINILKRLGDISLYVSGFFNEHILKSPVGKRYYADMGASAYLALSDIFGPDNVFSALYGELARRFVDLSGVIGELSLPHEIHNNISLLRMYERWIKTGDENLRKKLLQEGLIPSAKKISC